MYYRDAYVSGLFFEISRRVYVRKHAVGAAETPRKPQAVPRLPQPLVPLQPRCNPTVFSFTTTPSSIFNALFIDARSKTHRTASEQPCSRMIKLAFIVLICHLFIEKNRPDSNCSDAATVFVYLSQIAVRKSYCKPVMILKDNLRSSRTRQRILLGGKRIRSQGMSLHSTYSVPVLEEV